MIAKGCPDLSLCWMFDLQMGLANIVIFVIFAYFHCQVIAKGCPDLSLCWMFDLQMGLANIVIFVIFAYFYS